MPKLANLEDRFIVRLAELAVNGDLPKEFEEDLVTELLHDVAGPAAASAILGNLLNGSLIRQTSSDPVTFEITMTLLQRAEGISDRMELANNISSPTAASTPNFQDFKRQLLIGLFEKSVQSDEDYLDLKSVADDLGLNYPKGWVRKAAYQFRDQRWINDAFTMGGGPDGGLDAEITADGIEEAQELLKNSRGEKSTRKTGSVIHEEIWEPLPLEVGTSEATEATVAVEEVIEAVRSDNGYAATYPAEQKSILWALGSGVNALREGLVTRYALDNFLLKPLRKLIERFVDAAIQISAKKALEKVLALFTNV